MVEKVVVSLVCLGICSAQQTSSLPGGTISGILKGDEGTLAVGGNLLLRRTPTPSLAKRNRNEWNTTSGSQGAFRFDLLPPGQYTLCAQVPGSGWMNPCEWGLDPPPPIVTISGQQRSISVTMVMRKGVTVPIRVEDPGRLLEQHEGKTPGAFLLLGVFSDASVFHPAPVISKDASGRNHEIVVPHDTPVKIIVTSSFFQLNDAAGRQLSRTGPAEIPVTVPLGQTASTIRLVVTGVGR